MTETEAVKKKNKKKKKPSVENTPIQLSSTQPDKNSVDKVAFNIAGVLPQQVGMKTVFKDVEVTMTHSGTASGTSKKKKKKNKGKQPIEEAVGKTITPSETDNQDSFFKFNENHIELVNHPEISVTLSKSVKNQSKVPLEKEKKSDPAPVNKELEVTSTSSSNSKKKKKKKKKKNSETQIPTEEVIPDASETNSNTPTYVKLPASGDNCVLLVSHESFSSENKLPVNNTANTSGTVLIKSKEDVINIKQAVNPNSNQASGSVSIFPVEPIVNKMASSRASEINMDSSLQNVEEEETKTKAQLKAERRAKQEAQRAAKLAKTGEKDPAKVQDQVKVPSATKPVLPLKQSNEQSTNKLTTKFPVENKAQRKVLHFFSHLPKCKDFEPIADDHLKIHPAILELGAHYSKGILFGSNARCVGFLAAFLEVIRDCKTPPEKEFSRELEAKLQTNLNFLNSCRPLSVSIDNSVRFLKHQINHVSKEMNEVKAKEALCLSINNFVKEEILLAKEAIYLSATAKIVDGDTILVYAYSSLVKDVLCRAHDQNKSFRVVVIDSRPKLEGLEMLRRLNRHGIQCSYASINTASFVMKTVSKVIIGAHALLSNGCVMSRLGCKQLALIASSYSIPVLVCCETYKFCERALTDSFVHNELGKADDLIELSIDKNDSLKNFKSLHSLQVVNLLYDVTPSGLISVVITEKGLLPCTSVPVVLRVKQAGL